MTYHRATGAVRRGLEPEEVDLEEALGRAASLQAQRAFHTHLRTLWWATTSKRLNALRRCLARDFRVRSERELALYAPDPAALFAAGSRQLATVGEPALTLQEREQYGACEVGPGDTWDAGALGVSVGTPPLLTHTLVAPPSSPPPPKRRGVHPATLPLHRLRLLRVPVLHGRGGGGGGGARGRGRHGP